MIAVSLHETCMSHPHIGESRITPLSPRMASRSGRVRTAPSWTARPSVGGCGSEDQVVADEALELVVLEQEREQAGLEVVAERPNPVEGRRGLRLGLAQGGEVRPAGRIVEQLEEAAVRPQR